MSSPRLTEEASRRDPLGFLVEEQVRPLKKISVQDLDELYVFHKPGAYAKSHEGYVCGFSLNMSSRERPTLREYFIQTGLDQQYPVDEMIAFGRLDKDTSGLLVLSKKNSYPKFIDHLLLNPIYKKKHRKTAKLYRARVKGAVSSEMLLLKKTVRIPTKNEIWVEVGIESIRCLAVEVNARSEALSTVEIEICEGKHHQVKKMFYALGHPVCKGGLHRLRFSMLTLRSAPEADAPEMEAGQIRKLFEAEKEELVLLYNEWLVGERKRLLID